MPRSSAGVPRRPLIASHGAMAASGSRCAMRLRNRGPRLSPRALRSSATAGSPRSSLAPRLRSPCCRGCDRADLSRRVRMPMLCCSANHRRVGTAWAARCSGGRWAGPVVGAVGLVGDGPPGVVFGAVVAAAQRVQVVSARRAAVAPRLAMVEVAAACGSATGGEDAGAISGDHEVGEVARSRAITKSARSRGGR